MAVTKNYIARIHGARPGHGECGSNRMHPCRRFGSSGFCRCLDLGPGIKIAQPAVQSADEGKHGAGGDWVWHIVARTANRGYCHLLDLLYGRPIFRKQS